MNAVYDHEALQARGPVQRLDERRYALAVDGVVRYVGTEEECQRRLAMLVPKTERADQDKALGRLWRILR